MKGNAMKNYFSGNISNAFIPIKILLIAAGLLSSCAAQTVLINEEQQENREVYLLEVNSPQEAMYNGKPREISYTYSGDTKPDVVYFMSSNDMAEDRRGSRTAPVNAGVYYVRVTPPAGNKDNPVKEFFITFIIRKRPVKIAAEKPQTVVYDGNPKRIQASADPPVPLSFSYYPNVELLETAKRIAEEASSGQESITQSFKGYRRIDRAPSEPGIYYVWIYYPGDENTESASLDVILSIEPPDLSQ